MVFSCGYICVDAESVYCAGIVVMGGFKRVGSLVLRTRAHVLAPLWKAV